MSKIFFVAIGIVLGLGVILGAVFYWRNFRGVGPSILEPPDDITRLLNGENKTNIPLKLPQGFSISVFASGLPGARVIAVDKEGNMWVSQTSEGKISMLEVKDSAVKNKSEIFGSLNRPHGLAFDPNDQSMLYFAESDKISRVRINTQDKPQKIADLSSGGQHFTRTLGFGPDNRLYVSIGSSCNVCVEKDARRAKIFSMNKDGSDFREFAVGLRNAVFFAWNPLDRKMWATEMGRDFLGDDLPPDELNIIKEGEPVASPFSRGMPEAAPATKNYGWPYCYGKQVRDTTFDPSADFDCKNTEPSAVDIPAHSAPLGLDFVFNSGWPGEYRNNLFIAYHGSWNRNSPTGYKVVRLRPDGKGGYSSPQDFITGWLTDDDRALGRPVDILVESQGVMYVSDDKAGVIYRVKYEGKI